MTESRLQRKEYLDKLIAFKDKNIIKIITGIRRCGKSTLMEIYQDYLRSIGVEEKQIIAINFEDYDFRPLRDPEKLHAYVKERMVPDKVTYVFWTKFSTSPTGRRLWTASISRRIWTSISPVPMPVFCPVRSQR